MIETKIVLKDKKGFHIRSAKNVCTKAMEYESQITFSFRNREYNAKSLISILSSCAQETDEIILKCNGPDEEEASKVITALISQEQI